MIWLLRVVAVAVTTLTALPAAQSGKHVTSGRDQLDAPPADSVATLAKSLVGSWACRGGTPDGRTMAATISFTLVLDAHWLQFEHRDVPPGRFLATAMWPATTITEPMSTTLYDNSGGNRRLTGAWDPDSIVWVKDVTEPGVRRERFTFRRVDTDTFWYAWHIQRAATGPPVLGDSLTCRRTP